MRPIDADALMVEVQKGTIISDDLYGIGIMAGVDSFAKKLEAAPTLTLDDLRPKGRWADKQNENVWCSVCRCHPLKDMDKDSVYYWKYEPDFCPSCGADMRGGGEDE